MTYNEGTLTMAIGEDVTQHAKATADRLKAAANELRIAGQLRGTPAAKELAEMDASACEDATDLLRKLDTEVFRLREAIGCWYYGRLSRSDLVDISRTWNTP